MQIHLIGPNRPPTLGERIVAGLVLLTALGAGLLLLSVSLIVGVLALGIGLVVFGLWWLRELWRRHFGRPSSASDPRSATPPRATRGILEGEFIVVDDKSRSRHRA